jgi:hypothetical protein
VFIKISMPKGDGPFPFLKDIERHIGREMLNLDLVDWLHVSIVDDGHPNLAELNIVAKNVSHLNVKRNRPNAQEDNWLFGKPSVVIHFVYLPNLDEIQKFEVIEFLSRTSYKFIIPGLNDENPFWFENHDGPDLIDDRELLGSVLATLSNLTAFPNFMELKDISGQWTDYLPAVVEVNDVIHKFRVLFEDHIIEFDYDRNDNRISHFSISNDVTEVVNSKFLWHLDLMTKQWLNFLN